ncbi:MAG: response regulator [Chthoniobacteraceae bacterium]|nr:response regulator [Chthoniobacteraceae bacterium]
MPSLRVLPAGNPMVFGDVLQTNCPGADAISFLLPVPIVQAANAVRVSSPDLVLFALDASHFAEPEGVRRILGASAGLPSVVIVLSEDDALALESLRAGAEEVLLAGGLAPAALARALVHAWQRHAVRCEAESESPALAAKLERASRSVHQLSTRMKEEADERARAEKALVETVGRYRFLLDSLPQIVWTADARGDLVYLNHFWTAYSGRSIQGTLAAGWGDSIHPDDRDTTRERLERSLASGESLELQHRLRNRDGAYRWHELRAVPRRDAAGKILEWIGTEADIDDQKRVEERLTEAHDELGIRILERTSELAYANEQLQAEVAERRRAETEARRAREIAEAANRSKTEFLANISHEIRTPMNGIIGMTELALETDLNHQQREYLQLVSQSADSLLSLINDMLDFAKIEAGRMELASEPFSLRQMLQEAAKALGVRAGQKGIGIDLEIDPGVPARIVGDSLRLRQILVNLLGNAVKFTEKGGVTLRVSERSAHGDTVELLFEVRDTGIGIPEDKQTVIFEAFAQVDGSMTRRFGGTGLGLAIVSSLVQKMGGTVRVQSTLGEGSNFSFNLPAAVAEPLPGEDEAPIAPLPVEVRREPAAPLRVMIAAEEGSETAASLSEMLQKMGLESTVAGLGEAALGEIERSRARGRSYRLVMVDALLGDMSGAEFVQALIKASEFKAPVVLMVPGSATSEEVKQAWGAGPDWVLYKPIIQADLMEAVERSLLMVEPDSAIVSEPEEEEEEPLPPARPGGKPPLRVLVAEDNMVNQIVAERILSSFGCVIVTVSNGREAVAAVEREPFDLILMDIQMPEMDGMEATRRIRSLPDSRAHLPIVAMTAHAMKGDRERFLAAGLDHYISKPFHKDELLLLIKSIEPRARQTGASLQTPPPNYTEPGEHRADSLERFLQAMGGDVTLFRGACGLFSELMPGRLAELDAALEACHADEAGRLARDLKGSLDSVGARETSERVAVMEANLRSRDFPAARALFSAIEGEIRAILCEIRAGGDAPAA